MKSSLIDIVALALACGCLAASAATPVESVKPLLGQPIASIPGRTLTSVVVELRPGARADPHHHGEAFVYAYVLSGSVRSQLDDGPAMVYRAGENWYEAPGAHHVLTENTSRSKPARILVVFVAPTGAPLKVPDPH